MALRETLVAGISMVASEVVESSPWISDVFDDKSKRDFLLTSVGSEEEKCGICPCCCSRKPEGWSGREWEASVRTILEWWLAASTM